MVQIGSTPALSRRNFLTGCSACAMCLRSAAPASVTEPAPGGKPRVRLAFTHPDPKIQGWPYQGYDYEKRKTELTARLARSVQTSNSCPLRLRMRRRRVR
jgi:hypothetical protein